MWTEERIAWRDGYRCIAGIDEVGRGALAGPVVAACVVLPLDWDGRGIADSKTLTAIQRITALGPILSNARGVGIGIVESTEIDSINILRATHKAMRLALADLPPGLRPDIALIDGLPVRPFPVLHVALVRGDGRSISIAAASIVAKVTRDQMMAAYDGVYPGYGFAAHKGYGSPTHLKALASQGPCPIHRHTFRPVANSMQID